VPKIFTAHLGRKLKERGVSNVPTDRKLIELAKQGVIPAEYECGRWRSDDNDVPKIAAIIAGLPSARSRVAAPEPPPATTRRSQSAAASGSPQNRASIAA
jgi:hypothetical protein